MKSVPSLRVGVVLLLLLSAALLLWGGGLFSFPPALSGSGLPSSPEKGMARPPVLPGWGKKGGSKGEAGPGTGAGTPGRKKVLSGKDLVSQGKRPGLLVVRVWEKRKGGPLPPRSSKVHLEAGFQEEYEERPFLLGRPEAPPEGKDKRVWVFTVGERGVLALRLWGEGGILPGVRTKFRLWAESEGGKLVSERKVIRAGPRVGIWLQEESKKVRLDKGIDLVLHLRRNLEFLVMDGEGRGVPGVPVGLYSTPSDIDKYHYLFTRSESGPGGKGAFLDPGPRMRVYSGARGIDFKRYFLGFLFPLAKTAQRFFPIRKENLGGTPVEMLLPPAGQVAVHVSMPGRPGRGISGWAALHDPAMQWRDGWARGPVGESRSWIRRHSVPLRHGEALFPYVGLGMDLDLLILPKGSVNFTEKRIRGPSVPGERVHVDVLLSQDPVLTLRLAGSKGEVLSGKKVEISIFLDSDPPPVFPGIGVASFQEIGRTGPSGDLRILLPSGFYEGKSRVIFLVVRDPKEGQVLFGRIQAFEGARPAEWNLGVVRLASLPLIAAGRVVIPGGGDVSGSAVVCKVLRIQLGKPVWWPVGRCLVGPDGRFRFRSLLKDREVKLLASLEEGGLWGKAEKVPLGADHVVLELFRGGEIRGRLLVDDGRWLKQKLLRVYLYPRFELKSLHWDPVKKVEESGRFSYEGCPPGAYDFFVTIGWWPGIPVYRLAGLKFLSGEKPFQGDLGVIDLRGRLEKVELEFFDEKGRPVDFFHPRRPVRVEGIPERVIQKERNKILFLKRRGEILEIRVSVRGFKKKKITVGGTGGKVVLEKQ